MAAEVSQAIALSIVEEHVEDARKLQDEEVNDHNLELGIKMSEEEARSKSAVKNALCPTFKWQAHNTDRAVEQEGAAQEEAPSPPPPPPPPKEAPPKEAPSKALSKNARKNALRRIYRQKKSTPDRVVNQEGAAQEEVLSPSPLTPPPPPPALNNHPNLGTDLDVGMDADIDADVDTDADAEGGCVSEGEAWACLYKMMASSQGSADKIKAAKAREEERKVATGVARATVILLL